MNASHQPVIDVEQVGKTFQLGELHRHGFLRWLRRRPGGNASTAQPQILHALRDVSFQVGEGEVFGIIGANGAGKSTLLKILAGITDPSEGKAVLRGRIASLLEVGTGFHPELTGRENVFLNGTLLGLREVEIREEYDRMVDFAGLARFMDTPVKRYSSGMQVRLAFAVAAHLRPEILLIDEVLAVGDIAFQRKCLGAMKDVAGGGRTVLFVSHNMAAISSLCHRVLMLQRGQVVAVGNPGEVIQHYLETSSESHILNQEGFVCLSDREPKGPHASLILHAVRIVDDRGRPVGAVRSGDTLHVEVVVQGLNQSPSAVAGVTVRTGFDQKVFHFNSAMSGGWKGPRHDLEIARLSIPNLPLMAGAYSLDVLAFEPGVRLMDRVDGAQTFTVVESDIYGHGYRGEAREGLILVQGSSRIEKLEEKPQ